MPIVVLGPPSSAGSIIDDNEDNDKGREVRCDDEDEGDAERAVVGVMMREDGRSSSQRTSLSQEDDEEAEIGLGIGIDVLCAAAVARTDDPGAGVGIEGACMYRSYDTAAAYKKQEEAREVYMMY